MKGVKSKDARNVELAKEKKRLQLENLAVKVTSTQPLFGAGQTAEYGTFGEISGAQKQNIEVQVRKNSCRCA